MNNKLEVMVSKEISKLLSRNFSYNESVNYFKTFLLGVSRKFNTSPIQIIDQVILYHCQPAAKVDNNVLEFLRAYRVSAISRRRKGTSQQIKEASQGKVKLDTASLNDVVLTQNRARGKTFEHYGLGFG